MEPGVHSERMHWQLGDLIGVFEPRWEVPLDKSGRLHLEGFISTILVAIPLSARGRRRGRLDPIST